MVAKGISNMLDGSRRFTRLDVLRKQHKFEIAENVDERSCASEFSTLLSKKLTFWVILKIRIGNRYILGAIQRETSHLEISKYKQAWFKLKIYRQIYLTAKNVWYPTWNWTNAQLKQFLLTVIGNLNGSPILQYPHENWISKAIQTFFKRFFANDSDRCCYSWLKLQ